MANAPSDPSGRFRARLDRLRATVSAALVYGATEYANGNGRSRPIVDAHFTAGNAERYAWPPLSEAYFKAKQAGIVKHGGGSYYLNPAERAQAARIAAAEKSGNAALGGHYGGGRKAFIGGKVALREGSAIDKAVPYFAKASKEGEAAGLAGAGGSGANLPMLVLTSELRTAMNSRQHTVVLIQGGTVARILFKGLPEYAKWLHEGTPRMPARSPVTPNEDDRAMVVAAMRRFLDRALGKVASPVAGAGAQPNRARIA